MTVLITGGAGYIGSHMAHAFVDAGKNIVILDNLSTGIRSLVPTGATFVNGSTANPALLDEILPKYKIEAIVHFAASTIVPESVANPLEYYANNSTASRILIEACVKHRIRHFIFSSTAAVYGVTAETPVSERVLPQPINPYGRSKLMTEWMLEDTANAHDFRFIALRYFNVAGADPKGRTGQSTPNTTHLIKRACQAALGRIECLEIFGTDFSTPDGTGVRDYIHVSDLIAAHLSALDFLRAGNASMILNCGYGRGYSVREIVAAVEKVSGASIRTVEQPARLGDPPVVIADSNKLRAVLEWAPQLDDIHGIIGSALAWERGLCRGGSTLNCEPATKFQA